MNNYIISEINRTILIALVLTAWLVTLYLSNNNPLANYTLFLLWLARRDKLKEKSVAHLLDRLQQIEQRNIDKGL